MVPVGRFAALALAISGVAPDASADPCDMAQLCGSMNDFGGVVILGAGFRATWSTAAEPPGLHYQLVRFPGGDRDLPQTVDLIPSAGDCQPAEHQVTDPLGEEGDVYRLEVCHGDGTVYCAFEVTALPASACGPAPTCLDLRDSLTAELEPGGVRIEMSTIHADTAVAYYKLLRQPRRPESARSSNSAVVVGVANATSGCGVEASMSVLDPDGRRGDRYRLEVYDRRDRLACRLAAWARRARR